MCARAGALRCVSVADDPLKDANRAETKSTDESGCAGGDLTPSRANAGSEELASAGVVWTAVIANSCLDTCTAMRYVMWHSGEGYRAQGHVLGFLSKCLRKKCGSNGSGDRSSGSAG